MTSLAKQSEFHPVSRRTPIKIPLGTPAPPRQKAFSLPLRLYASSIQVQSEERDRVQRMQVVDRSAAAFAAANGLLAEQSSFRSTAATLSPFYAPAVSKYKGKTSSMASGVMASLAMATLEVQEDPVATASKDLLVIGPGVLGKLVGGLWIKEFPGCSVVGQTATTNHHEELQALGIKPLLKGSQSERSFPYVVFCAPPSGSLDYAAELRLAAEQWNRMGVFLFTSSSAVYDCMDNGECDEDTPIVPLGRSQRTDVLLHAEQEVLEVGGTVLRMAGLYTKERGPHTYWAKKGIVESRPDHILNLIHYEDAASLCVAILKKGYHKEVFMGCDNHPLSRQEVMNIVSESEKLKDNKFEAFTGIDGPLGKKMNCNRTRSKTGWQPKYTSFADFIQNVA